MQDASNPKQLIVEKLKQSANILVTVSANPSVDSLAAALGLTLMLNKLDKHATAVFSGVVPPAISFLEPDKTFENNVDSLRDFIIALDKEKADRLRYKVEDDVVRIFITPYRTKISDKDLQFSQGDFNIDLIVALGVENQKDLDQAITAHGRILHDATVVTVNANGQKSSLGSTDWQDSSASSLSEMLAGIADSLKQGILDQQISTALLTGIVASTERFSNQLTTPHVMTISAQLMAAGANQQLIATKLQTIPAPVSPRKAQEAASKSIKKQPEGGDNGEMHINHGEESEPQPVPPAPEAPQELPKEEPKPAPEEPELPIAPPAAQAFNDLKEALNQETVQSVPQREMLETPPAPGSRSVNDEAIQPEEPQQAPEPGYLASKPSWQNREIQPPSMGGTLNATAEQALEESRRVEDEERNHKILTHGTAAEATEPQPAPVEPAAPAPAEPAVPVQPVPQQPAVEQIPEIPGTPPPLVVSEPVQPVEPTVPPAPTVQPAPEVPSAPAPEAGSSLPPLQTEPTIEQLEKEAANHAAQAVAPQTLSELESERRQTAPAEPALPVLPSLPGMGTPQPPAPAASAEPVVDLTGVQPAPQPGGLPALPPMPDFSTLPPLPTEPQQPGAMPQMPQPGGLPTLGQTDMPQMPQTPPATPPQSPQTPPSPSPSDPTQFRIPGQ